MVDWVVGWKIFFEFSSLFGEDEPHFDEHIFQMGGENHQLVDHWNQDTFFAFFQP